MRVASVSSPASSAITIHGRTLSLPIEVRDSKSVFATFAVSAAAARRLFSQTAVRLAEILPGRTLVSISAVEHVDNDLGPYNEVVIAFPVTIGPREHWPLIGPVAEFASGRGCMYIHQMPVTTAFACAAGREIWGLPKMLADVSIDDQADRRVVTLTVDGVHALTLSGPRGGRMHFRDAAVDVVAIRDGRAWKTTCTSSAEGVSIRLAGAMLTLGPHPIGVELAALGLPKRALASGWVEHMTARFQAPSLLDS